MNNIIKMLPKKRQTCLFSATNTNKVQDLARLSLNKPVSVKVCQSVFSPLNCRVFTTEFSQKLSVY